MLGEHADHLFRMQQRLHGDQQTSRDALLSKLAARKRMKEETLSDKVVSEELTRIQNAQVSGRREVLRSGGGGTNGRTGRAGR